MGLFLGGSGDILRADHLYLPLFVGGPVAKGVESVFRYYDGILMVTEGV